MSEDTAPTGRAVDGVRTNSDVAGSAALVVRKAIVGHFRELNIRNGCPRSESASDIRKEACLKTGQA